MKKKDFRSSGFPTKEMYDFPNIINVEVYSGDCPCRCVHCPVGATEPGRRKERFGHKGIGLELYKKIVAEISKYPHSTLRIHSVGEPLRWKNLIDALKLSHNSSVKSWIFTSAVTSDTSLLEAICKNTNIVEVSVNSVTPEDYKATKGINAFEMVFENIRHMRNFIKRNKLSTRLIASRVQSPTRVKDEEFVKYWQSSGLVDDAFVRTYHTYNDLMAELEEKQPKQHQPCLVHWGRFNISTEGYVIVCFNELFKEHLEPSLILGNVNKQTIAEIWHGHKLTALRKAELCGNYSTLSFEKALPCKDCTSCQPLRGSRQTSEHQIKQIN